MGADVVYRVVIDLSTRGDLGSQLGSTVSKLGALDSALQRSRQSGVSMASALSSSLESVAERAATVATHFAKLGAVAIGAGVAYGVVRINNELEKTQISLAAIFGANGLTKNMPEGMGVAADVVAKMRKDVAVLPGELKDLVGIFKTISVPGFQAGASINELRALSGKAMAASAVVGIPMAQASRELAMLLEGRAGAHNVLGMRLAGLSGDKAQHFNHLTAPERLKVVTKEIEKYSGAIEQYGKSFAGISTTFKDNAKRFLGLATEPLFDRIKQSLVSANTWFDKHEGRVTALAHMVGNRLGYAWDWVVEKAKALEPVLERIGARVETALSPKHMKETLAHAGEAYVGLKLAPTLIGSARGGGALAELVGGAGPASVVLLALAGAVSALHDKTSVFHKAAVTAWDGILAGGHRLFEALAPLGKAVLTVAEALGTTLLEAVNAAMPAIVALAQTLTDLIKPIADLIGKARGWYDTAAHRNEPGRIDHFEGADQRVVAMLKMRWLAEHAPTAIGRTAARTAATAIANQGYEGDGPSAWMADRLRTKYANLNPKDKAWMNDMLSGYKKTVVIDTASKVPDAAVETKPGEKEHGDRRPQVQPGAGGGGGGVHIARVEITIAENHDPNRVARVVAGHLANMSRYRKSSPFTPNFSASR